MGNLLFILALAAILVRCFRKMKRGQLIFALTSGLAAFMYLLCLWIPAHLQAADLIVSKIERAQIVYLPTSSEVDDLSFRWALELTVIFFAEIFAVYRSTAKRVIVGNPTDSELNEKKRVAILLLAIGFISTFALPAPSIEDRAVGGQGFGTVMRSFLVVGLALVCYYNFFKSNHFKLFAIVGLALLVAKGVRSPVIVVAFGYLAGLISRGELRAPQVLKMMMAGTILAVLSAGMSMYRGAEIRGETISFEELITGVLESPYAAVYEAGVDTLDGYRLAKLIQPFEPSQFSNILTVFTNFVPRAIWPDKPADLSVNISAVYLGYGAGGQFLSPIGYMSIAFGGYFGALAGMFIFIFLASKMSIRFRNSFILAIIICIVFRFMMGGSPFDIYYGLVLLLPLFLCSLVVRFFGPKKTSFSKIG